VNLIFEWTQKLEMTKLFTAYFFPDGSAAHLKSSSNAQGFKTIQTVKQVHGAKIVSWPCDSSTEADGICSDFSNTAEPNALGVYTADCLPVCIAWSHHRTDSTANSSSNIIGNSSGNRAASEAFGAVIHAGWRGFADGILQEGLKLCPQLPDSIVLGPSIFGESYECGLEVQQALEAFGAPGILAKNGKCFPDLQQLAATWFVEKGVPPKNITVVRVNTYTNPSLPSYRRACLLNEPRSRRMMTVLSNHKSSC
jgi:copper oxidase (laccase) domain-containing protein